MVVWQSWGNWTLFLKIDHRVVVGKLFFSNEIADWRSWHICYPVNFAIFIRISLLKTPPGDCCYINEFNLSLLRESIFFSFKYSMIVFFQLGILVKIFIAVFTFRAMMKSLFRQKVVGRENFKCLAEKNRCAQVTEWINIFNLWKFVLVLMCRVGKFVQNNEKGQQ